MCTSGSVINSKQQHLPYLCWAAAIGNRCAASSEEGCIRAGVCALTRRRTAGRSVPAPVPHHPPMLLCTVGCCSRLHAKICSDSICPRAHSQDCQACALVQNRWCTADTESESGLPASACPARIHLAHSRFLPRLPHTYPVRARKYLSLWR